ncbi:MAG TPA: NAD-dependent epimerase/dehydratase family protein [Actinomycetota bacterium]|nr:NAD-dependent epimerase/dehydratase family protein [Actinomycetota bacterium]
MRYLILGGTRFVGRHVVRAALDEGHDVTLFTRGVTNPKLFPEAEHLQGDRETGELASLRGREWDRVVDVSGYTPDAVEATARLLRDASDHYTFVSTISVYRRWNEAAEESEVLDPPPPGEREVTGDTYGPLKVACEEVVREVFGRRALVVRPGIVVGPHDHTDRFTYWVARVAAGGEVAAPGPPETPVQVVDGRDLAEWLVWMAMRRRPGVYNATGPDYRLTFGRLLARIDEVTGSRASLRWIPERRLPEEAASLFPLWTPASEADRFTMTVDSTRARWEGLLFRPLGETIRDTLAWHRSRGEHLRAGPDEAEERRLLALSGSD